MSNPFSCRKFVNLLFKFLECIPNGQTNKKPYLVKKMAWHRTGDKPYLEQWWPSWCLVYHGLMVSLSWTLCLNLLSPSSGAVPIRYVWGPCVPSVCSNRWGILSYPEATLSIRDRCTTTRIRSRLIQSGTTSSSFHSVKVILGNPRTNGCIDQHWYRFSLTSWK